jgi:hypothetical protein
LISTYHRDEIHVTIKKVKQEETQTLVVPIIMLTCGCERSNVPAIVGEGGGGTK